jgi:signal transduction histidine kinase
VLLTRLTRTTSFRLAATYLGMFCASIAVLGGVVYFAVGRELVQQIDQRLIQETDRYLSEFRRVGVQPLAEHLHIRQLAGAVLDYRLEDSQGRFLAGHLPSLREEDGVYHEGWATRLIKIESGVDQPEFNLERTLVTRLGDGSILVVGDELAGVEEVRRAVLVAFGWALAATVVVGAGGGLLLSAEFLRRIDAMIATAQDIVAGDLSRRIPLTKGDADLKRLAAAFNNMLDRIGALLEANKHVSSAIAHDLRKPLARVLRGLETVRSGPADLARFEEAVDAATSDINGVLETFGALLRIGQIETGARLAKFENVDLAAIAQEVAEAYQPAAADEGKTLTFELSARLPMAGDCELLRQLTANLIDNSIRHTPAGSRIKVMSLTNHSGGKLIVVDDGPGVPASERDRIFERFYRVDTARETPGAGLGLSLVDAIARLHGAKAFALDNGPGLKIVVDLEASSMRSSVQ